MDAVRVTASISDVASGQIVRTAKVDGSVNAIFELQDRLVRELAGSLRAAISPTSTLPETEVVSAYEAFSRGLINRRDEGFDQETIEGLRAIFRQVETRQVDLLVPGPEKAIVDLQLSAKLRANR